MIEIIPEIAMVNYFEGVEGCNARSRGFHCDFAVGSAVSKGVLMQMYRRTSPRPNGLLALFALLVFAFVAAPALGESRHVSWAPDYALEKEMEALKGQGHDCLPGAYPLDFDPYVIKLAGALIDSCVTDNASAEQIQKYAMLAAGSMTPAGVYVLPYTVSELKSDAVKCVLKSFVGTSILNEAEKEDYRGDIDDIFTARDWAGFAGGVPGLTSVSPDEVAAALTETMLSGSERIHDTRPFSSAYAAVAEGRTLRSLKELWWKKSTVALDEYEYYLEGCRYDKAGRALERVTENAELECKALGHNYRSLEAKLRSDILRTYKTLDNDLIGDSQNTASLVSGLESTKRALQTSGQTLRTHVRVFAEIEETHEAELDDQMQRFEMSRLAYEGLYRRALDGLNSTRACTSIANLERDIERALAPLNSDSASCREALLGGGPGTPRLSPETLREELMHVARARSSEWSDKMDRIRASTGACNMDAAFSIRDQLLYEIANNPIFRVSDGTCSAQDQSPLLAALDDVVEPAHCKMVEVPTDIIGLTIPAAEKRLEAASLYLAGPITRVEPGDGDTSGTVAQSVPPPGSRVRAWSGVALVIYGDVPEEATDTGLVAVPELVGTLDTDAIDALIAAKLKPAFTEDIPADQEDLVPGFIQLADHAAGTMLPKGSFVILTRIGPRPMVSVPGVTGARTLAEAQAILAGARLTAGEALEGEAPPEGATAGDFYATEPPFESQVEMFSPVSPISYADQSPVLADRNQPPDVTLLAVPSVRDRSFKAASRVLAGFGGHFKVGKPALGPDRPEGSKVGDVYFTDPPAGKPVPKGTVITLYLYPPLEEEIDNLRQIPHEIIGATADQAAAMLRGPDDFFVVPAAKQADAAQDGNQPGSVQYAVPAVGTMAPRGSTVQLHVFRQAEQEMSMRACPDPNADPGSNKHRIDSNNNPDDQTYLDCSYFKDGALKLQLPVTDGERDGVELDHLNYPECGGRILTTRMIYSKGKREKWWSYTCDIYTRTYYTSHEETYSNGLTTHVTQWYSNGAKSTETQFDSNGKPAIRKYWNKNGEFTACRKTDANGNWHPCTN